MARGVSPEWQAKRLQVIARAGGMCERCGERKGQHVHHLVYGGKKRGTEPLEWLQLVCLQCHGDYHPHHTFRTIREQRAVAAKRAKRRAWKANRPEASCKHCGGAYKPAQHKAICVRFGLD